MAKNYVTPEKQALIDSWKDGLIVSCQTQPGDVIYQNNRTVQIMAKAAEWGEAVGIRANDPKQVAAIHEVTSLPIIGLYKTVYKGSEDLGLIMTPTLKAAQMLWDAGAKLIAADCTAKLNHLGEPRYNMIDKIHEGLPEAIVFADIDNYESVERAVDMGAEIVATTCWSPRPDFPGFARMAADFKDKVCVVWEGCIWTPEEACQALYQGAHAVVVGSAITRPHFIVKRMTQAMNHYAYDYRKDEAEWMGVITDPSEY